MKCKHNNYGHCLWCEADKSIELAEAQIRAFNAYVGVMLDSPHLSDEFKDRIRKLMNQDFDDKVREPGRTEIQKLEDYANGH